MPKASILDLKDKKRRGQKFAILTACDYPTAKILDEAGLELILVGDSLGMVCLGYRDTLPVTMDEMIHHAAAVSRGVQTALVVGDMPFLSYQVSVEDAVRNAGRMIKEGGADCVKLEGGRNVLDKVEAIVRAGIPVMGHVGLTPQNATQLGGYKVQGAEAEAARTLMEDAKALESAGVFSLVVECIPSNLGAKITDALKIPTIGIGAGPHCDGQILVYHDIVGLFDRFTPKFAKRYANVGADIKKAVSEFKREVESGEFPDKEHSFGG